MFREVWKDIVGYEGLYQVSNLGGVKSLGNGGSHKTETILKQSSTVRGHLHVALCKNGKRKYYYTHVIEWEAFNGPIPEGMQVNHINEKTSDNRLENLNLMTPKENCNWGTRNRRGAEKRINHPRFSKWIIKLSLNNEILHFYPSAAQAERETGICKANIGKCCKGKRNNAGGFIWKYA